MGCSRTGSVGLLLILLVLREGVGSGSSGQGASNEAEGRFTGSELGGRGSN